MAERRDKLIFDPSPIHWKKRQDDYEFEANTTLSLSMVETDTDEPRNVLRVYDRPEGDLGLTTGYDSWGDGVDELFFFAQSELRIRK